MARRTSSKQKTTPDTPKQQDFDPVDFVVKSFTQSWDYTQSNYHKLWEDAWKLYNNQRVKRGYVGITDTFVPMTFSTIETLVAALAGSKPQFDFIPPHQNPDQNTKILNSLLDYYWDKDQWNVKVISWVRSMLLNGTGVVYLMWDIDHPVMVNVPIRDFIIDPMATDLNNARFMGRRYLTTLEELKSFEVADPETGEMVKKYKNLDRIEAMRSGEEQTDKELKDLFYGSTVTDADKEQVEVIELWTKDKCYSVANRSICIEDCENYHLTQAKKSDPDASEGLIPFAAQRNYIDESLFYGKSEVDPFKDQQELLNDLTNQNTDAVTFNLNQMYTLDPDASDMIEQIENLPGAVYPLKDGQLKPIPMQAIPQNAFQERINIKNEIRETTASDQVLKGVSGTGAGDQTATEVQAQVAAAAQRFGIKVTQLENEGFHRLARIIFSMVKLYVNAPMLVRIVGKDGVQWEEFNPEEFMDGEYEPRVQLQSTVEAHKQDDINKNKELMASLLADPMVNKNELYKLVLPKVFDLDPDEVQALLTPDPSQMMPGMGAPTDQGMPQAGAPEDQPSDLPPGVDPFASDNIPQELIEAGEA